MTSDKLLAFNQLVDNLKTIKYGYYRWPKRVYFDSESTEFTKIVDNGLYWTDEFLLDARTEYTDLSMDGFEPGALRSLRPKSLAYSATMLRIMAAAWHDWNLLYPSKSSKRLTSYIRRLSCQPRANTGFWVRTGILAHGGTSLTARIADVRATVDELVRQAS